MKREGQMWLHETSLNVWEEDVDEAGMYPVLQKVLDRLRRRGFAVTHDPNTLKNYPTLARMHWLGKRGDLEFHASLSGRHLQLEFFQNVVSGGNRNGGRYDFGKFRLMPHRMRLQFIVDMALVAYALGDVGYRFQEDGHAVEPLEPSPLMIRDIADGRRSMERTPLERFDASWRSNRFERDESGWPPAKRYASCGWENLDRDKKLMAPGDVRYFRHRGRLMRAQVYPHMNGQWQVVYGGSHTYKSGDARPDQAPRRLVPGQIERLEKEISIAIKAKNYAHVAALGRALQRTAEAA